MYTCARVSIARALRSWAVHYIHAYAWASWATTLHYNFTQRRGFAPQCFLVVYSNVFSGLYFLATKQSYYLYIVQPRSIIHGTTLYLQINILNTKTITVSTIMRTLLEHKIDSTKWLARKQSDKSKLTVSCNQTCYCLTFHFAGLLRVQALMILTA